MKKIKFPQFIDRSRLLFIFEMDMMLVMFGGSIFFIWIFSKILLMVVAVPLSFYLGFKLMKLYEVAKYEKAPGFIRHFFYKKGILKPKIDFEKYPELKKRDNPNFYPPGYITHFSD